MSTYRDDYELEYAYGRIHRFFDAFGLPGAIEYTESIIEAAASQRVWNHAAPCSLLFFMQNMEELLSAAYILYHCQEEKPGILITPQDSDVPDVTDIAAFTDQYCSVNPWENFPRTLTAKQFHDPSRAIYKCCKSMSKGQWRKFLKDLMEYALDRDTINLVIPGYNMFTMRRRVLRLIEACHLVHVRINRKKEVPALKTGL